MAKLTHIAAGVLIAAGTAFGAVKGYAHWRVSSQLEELARLVSPYAELRWDGISTELQGGIEVTGLTISPRLIPEDIAIESVRLETGDPRLLLSGLPRRTSDAPEKISLAVRGVRVPLSGSLLDGLQRRQRRRCIIVLFGSCRRQRRPSDDCRRRKEKEYGWFPEEWCGEPEHPGKPIPLRRGSTPRRPHQKSGKSLIARRRPSAVCIVADRMPPSMYSSLKC